MTYANKTDVSPDKTMNEIRTTLRRWGADKFAFVDETKSVTVLFEYRQRRVRFCVPLPDKSDAAFIITKGAYKNRGFSQNAYDQAVRARWRALLLVIKAKLESVESGIETFEAAFMAQLLLANGQTMEEWAVPQINDMFEGRVMPPLLGSGL